MVFLRSAAMGFNRIVDKKYDAANPRTKDREVASGQISLRNAWTFVILFLILFFITALLINPMTGILSPFAAFFVLFYSFTKRFTYFCHFVLGFAIGLAPLAAWVAVLGTIESWIPFLWSAGLMFYIAGFDILYACQDIDFDKKSGLYSIPANLGASTALITAKISHGLSILAFIAAGILSSSGWIYYISLLIVSGLFIAEHKMVRYDDFSKIPIAFFNVNASISSILFFGLLLDTFFHFGVY